MENFYKKLDAYKTQKGLSYSKLGAVIDKTGDAMRMAVTRESLSPLEKERLEKMFAGSEQTKKDPPQSMEDLLATSVLEKLMPIINKVLESHQKIIKELLQQGLEIDQLMDDVEEIKETTNTILKEVKELH